MNYAFTSIKIVYQILYNAKFNLSIDFRSIKFNDMNYIFKVEIQRKFTFYMIYENIIFIGHEKCKKEQLMLFLFYVSLV